MPPVTCKNYYIIAKLAMVPQMRDADLGQSCHSFPSVASLPRGAAMVSSFPRAVVVLLDMGALPQTHYFSYH